jgi:hypothetical protein
MGINTVTRSATKTTTYQRFQLPNWTTQVIGQIIPFNNDNGILGLTVRNGGEWISIHCEMEKWRLILYMHSIFFSFHHQWLCHLTF